MRRADGPGRPFPLGVTLEADGANVAVFSAHATAMTLCLVGDADGCELRVDLSEHTDGVFHGFVGGLTAGQVYGLRAHGPWAPERGHRFNPNRLLLDPYAKAPFGRFHWSGPNLVDQSGPLASIRAILQDGPNGSGHGGAWRTPAAGPPRAWADTVSMKPMSVG